MWGHEESLHLAHKFDKTGGKDGEMAKLEARMSWSSSSYLETSLVFLSIYPTLKMERAGLDPCFINVDSKCIHDNKSSTK